MKIKQIRRIEKEKTHDLNINDNHNYFVGESEILVHNSGKDSTKIDRSAAYLARYIAKNVVASGISKECKVEIAYMIGIAEPASLNIDTFGDADDDKLADIIMKIFPMTPSQITKHFKLTNPIFGDTAKNGHFGRENLAWEKTDKTSELKEAMLSLLTDKINNI